MLTRLAETTQACFKHFKSKCDSRWLKLHHASWLRPRHFFPSAQAPIPAQTESPVANGGPSRKVRGIAERLSCNQTDKDWRVPRKPAIPRSFAVERVLAADVSNDIEKPSDSPPLFIQWYPILINDIDLRNWSEAHRGAFQANVGFLQANEPQSFFSGSAAPICCRMNLSWRTRHNCTSFFRMMSGQPSYGMPWICADRKDAQSPGSPETSYNLTCVSVEWFPNNPNGNCQGTVPTVPEFGSPLRTSKQQHQESTELSLGQSDGVFLANLDSKYDAILINYVIAACGVWLCCQGAC